MAMPVAIQSIEPTRLDIHHNVNKVILLKVVNPDTSPMVGDGEKTSIRHDSPIQSFGGFSHVKSSDRESKYPQLAQGTRLRFSSKKKMSTAVKETFIMDKKLKYFNFLNNLNSSAVRRLAKQNDQHEMPNISFASGGDSDTLDYIAYVAKESPGGNSSHHSGPPVPARACYVLECGGGLAQDVITTIGQAFELRFKEFLKRIPSNRPPPLPPIPTHPPLHQDDVEYYNDLPGQAPPNNSGSSSSNLIDLSTELPGARGGEAEYMNSQVQDQRHHKSHHDPFDMSPLALAPPGGGIPSPVTPTPVQTPLHRAQLAKEDWFHGPISRKDAEGKLRNDGDFLVRESQGSPGQYVLTGMQGAIRKHLLLVDPEGVVRTKDRAFDNVSHLINFHRHNSLPIISAESALRLQHPVNKSRH